MKRRAFIKSGMAALSTLAVGEIILLSPEDAAAASGRKDAPPAPAARRRPIDYRKLQRVPSTCLNCSTVCGIVGLVQDGELMAIEGNPQDPNTHGTLCAKGVAAISINTYPERLLYPLKRVGKRGEGLWQRISWDEAYATLSTRIQANIDAGHPERVAIHQGRSRLGAEFNRFLGAIGSPVQLNHRALCSSNKRAANYASIGDTDWETPNAAKSRYILNFGSNFMECHQGSIHLARRVAEGRADNGARLVTFDVRLSNTAGRSDEWHAPFPGTDGLIALAMGHVILAEGLHNASFIDSWVNAGVDELRQFYAEYTPERAERESGIAAADIRRIAREFAAAAPAAVAFTNRGSQAHYNGFNNDRAVILLNALVGSIGREGGYTYMKTGVGGFGVRQPEPVPPKPKTRTDLEDPPEWPLANRWQKMRVGEIVYDYIKAGRAKLDVYLSYTLAAPLTWPEGRSLTVDVLKDESLIPFHACSDIVYSEMAHYADLILPDASYLERWGLDNRDNYELRPYIALRQPITPPPGECVSFADVLINIGKRLKPEQARYFQFANHEDFVRQQCETIRIPGAASAFDYLKTHGLWVDESKPKALETYKRLIPAADLAGSRTDEAGVVWRANAQGKEVAIGVRQGEVVQRGFDTPSRKFEARSKQVAQAAAQVNVADDGWPHYVPIPSHVDLPDDRLILSTFKWNVHTQSRTASQKLLSEIVHDNPLWINRATARSHGLKSGDWVEVTTYRPRGNTLHPTGEVLGSQRVRVHVTEGIHPKVVAISASLGHAFGGRAAEGRKGARAANPAYVALKGKTPASAGVLREDRDLANNLWWSKAAGGKGGGFNLNAIIPIHPAPVTGMQSWFDTVCTIRKV